MYIFIDRMYWQSFISKRIKLNFILFPMIGIYKDKKIHPSGWILGFYLTSAFTFSSSDAWIFSM